MKSRSEKKIRFWEYNRLGDLSHLNRFSRLYENSNLKKTTLVDLEDGGGKWKLKRRE